MIQHPLKWLEKHPKIAWGLMITYAGVIFFFSSMPVVPQPIDVNIYILTLEHALEYAGFGFLLLAAFRSRDQTIVHAVFLAFLVGVIYAITDEIHQVFVPGRVASIYDVVVDGIGITSGIWLGRL